MEAYKKITRKMKLLFLFLVLVVLVAAGVVIWLLAPSQQPTQVVEVSQEESAPEPGNSWMEDVRPYAENPPDLTYEEVQSELDELRAKIAQGDTDWDYPQPPKNYQMEAPPPSMEELQPGATTEVEPLVYEKPLLSLTHQPDDIFYYNLDPFNTLTQYYMEVEGMLEHHNLEKISVEEALQAEYLYLWWECDGTMRAYIQLGRPVEYYRILDYEPMTVIGVAQGVYAQADFAIRDGKLQRFILS